LKGLFNNNAFGFICESIAQKFKHKSHTPAARAMEASYRVPRTARFYALLFLQSAKLAKKIF
jgi:hypothetical protein